MIFLLPRDHLHYVLSVLVCLEAEAKQLLPPGRTRRMTPIQPYGLPQTADAKQALRTVDPTTKVQMQRGTTAAAD